MVAVLPNPNYSLYINQKVNVVVINEKPPTETNKETVQWRKSGDYIISEMEFVWNGISLGQRLRLIRKELGKNPEEIKEGPPPVSTQKDVKNPKNENPVLSEQVNDPIQVDLLNAKYVVGEVYTVENSEGARFLLTITNILVNGSDVSAKIQQIK